MLNQGKLSRLHFAVLSYSRGGCESWKQTAVSDRHDEGSVGRVWPAGGTTAQTEEENIGAARDSQEEWWVSGDGRRKRRRRWRRKVLAPGTPASPSDPRVWPLRSRWLHTTHLNTQIYTHKPGRSFWAGIFDTLPTDITTAGVNLAELSRGPPLRNSPPLHHLPHTHTSTPSPSMGPTSLTLCVIFFSLLSFFDPSKSWAD